MARQGQLDIGALKESADKIKLAIAKLDCPSDEEVEIGTDTYGRLELSKRKLEPHELQEVARRRSVRASKLAKADGQRLGPLGPTMFEDQKHGGDKSKDNADSDQEEEDVRAVANNDSDSDFSAFDITDLAADDTFNLANSKQAVDELKDKFRVEERVAHTEIIANWFATASRETHATDAELNLKEQDCQNDAEMCDESYRGLGGVMEQRNMRAIDRMRKFHDHFDALRPPETLDGEEDDDARATPNGGPASGKNAGSRLDNLKDNFAKDSSTKDGRRERARLKLEQEMKDHAAQGSDVGGLLEKQKSFRRQKTRGEGNGEPVLVVSDILEVIAQQQDEIAHLRTRNDIAVKKAEATRAALDHVRTELQHEDPDAPGDGPAVGKRATGNSRAKNPLIEGAKDLINETRERLKVKVMGDLLTTKDGRRFLADAQAHSGFTNAPLDSNLRTAELMEECEGMNKKVAVLQHEMENRPGPTDRMENLKEDIAQKKRQLDHIAAKRAKQLAAAGDDDGGSMVPGDSRSASGNARTSPRAGGGRGALGSLDFGDDNLSGESPESKAAMERSPVRKSWILEASETVLSHLESMCGETERSVNDVEKHSKSLAESIEAAKERAVQELDEQALGTVDFDAVDDNTELEDLQKEVKEIQKTQASVRDEGQRLEHEEAELKTNLRKSREAKKNNAKGASDASKLMDKLKDKERRTSSAVKDEKQTSNSPTRDKSRRLGAVGKENGTISDDFGEREHKKGKKQKEAAVANAENASRKTSDHSSSAEGDSAEDGQDEEGEVEVTNLSVDKMQESVNMLNGEVFDLSKREQELQERLARLEKAKEEENGDGQASDARGSPSSVAGATTEGSPAIPGAMPVSPSPMQSAAGFPGFPNGNSYGFPGALPGANPSDPQATAVVAGFPGFPQGTRSQFNMGPPEGAPPGPGFWMPIIPAGTEGDASQAAAMQQFMMAQMSAMQSGMTPPGSAGTAPMQPSVAATPLQTGNAPVEPLVAAAQLHTGPESPKSGGVYANPDLEGIMQIGASLPFADPLSPGAGNNQSGRNHDGLRPDDFASHETDPPFETGEGVDGQGADGVSHRPTSKEADDAKKEQRIIDKREEQITDLLWYEREKTRLDKQIQEVESRIREAKTHDPKNRGSTDVTPAASLGPVKTSDMPEENRSMRREVARKQRELNALRKRWVSEKARQGNAYDGTAPGQVEAATKILLHSPPELPPQPTVETPSPEPEEQKRHSHTDVISGSDEHQSEPVDTRRSLVDAVHDVARARRSSVAFHLHTVTPSLTDSAGPALGGPAGGAGRRKSSMAQRSTIVGRPPPQGWHQVGHSSPEHTEGDGGHGPGDQFSLVQSILATGSAHLGPEPGNFPTNARRTAHRVSIGLPDHLNSLGWSQPATGAPRKSVVIHQPPRSINMGVGSTTLGSEEATLVGHAAHHDSHVHSQEPAKLPSEDHGDGGGSAGATSVALAALRGMAQLKEHQLDAPYHAAHLRDAMTPINED